MIFSLVRFRLRPGTRARVEEWVRFADAHREAVREIMEPERMFVEAFFTETADGADYLYWYSMQGDHAEPAEPFDHWFDAHHSHFWRACIDDSVPAEELTPRIAITTAAVQQAMHT